MSEDGKFLTKGNNQIVNLGGGNHTGGVTGLKSWDQKTPLPNGNTLSGAGLWDFSKDKNLIDGNNNDITAGSGNDYTDITGDSNKVNLGDGNNIASIGVAHKDSNGNTIFDSGTNNTVFTGSGDDNLRVLSGSGNNLDAGEGSNNIELDSSGNTVRGGGGNDVVNSYSSNQTINLEGGKNTFTNAQNPFDQSIPIGGGNTIFMGQDAAGSSYNLNGGGGNHLNINSSHSSNTGITDIYGFKGTGDGHDTIYVDGRTYDQLQAEGRIIEVDNGHGGKDVHISGNEVNDQHHRVGNHTYVLHDTKLSDIKPETIATKESEDITVAQDQATTTHTNQTVLEAAVFSLLSAGLISFAFGVVNYLSLRQDFRKTIDDKVQANYDSQLNKHDRAKLTDLQKRKVIDEKECIKAIHRGDDKDKFVKDAKKSWGMSSALSGIGIGFALIGGIALTGVTLGAAAPVVIVFVSLAIGACTGYVGYNAGGKLAQKNADDIIEESALNPENKKGVDQAQKALEMRAKEEYGAQQAEKAVSGCSTYFRERNPSRKIEGGLAEKIKAEQSAGKGPAIAAT